VLAESQNDEAGAGTRIIGIGERDATIRGRLGEDDTNAGSHRRVGERGERARDLVDRPDPADVGERNEERVLRAVPAQLPHDLVARDFSLGEAAPDRILPVDDRAMRLFGRGSRQPVKPRRLLER
jgi:hypothetical protein